MLKVNKQEIDIDYSLKKRIEIICSFCNVTPIIHNGSIRTLEKTNLAYLEPHRFVVNGIIYLFFNNSEYVFINDLDNKIKLSELESYIKSH